MMRYRVAYVRWLDAAFRMGTGLDLLDDGGGPVEQRSAGWLIEEGDDYIVLALDLSPDGTPRYTLSIPSALIVELRVCDVRSMRRVYYGNR